MRMCIFELGCFSNEIIDSKGGSNQRCAADRHPPAYNHDWAYSAQVEARARNDEVPIGVLYATCALNRSPKCKEPFTAYFTLYRVLYYAKIGERV